MAIEIVISLGNKIAHHMHGVHNTANSGHHMAHRGLVDAVFCDHSILHVYVLTQPLT